MPAFASKTVAIPQVTMLPHAMIDTVRYYQRRKYKYSTSLASIKRGAPFISGFDVHEKGGKRYLVLDRSSGLRVGFVANAPYFVEVSRPRVFFGHNGRPIAWQDEIDAALQKVDSILDQFSRVEDPLRVYRRVDLVWQFKDDPARFYLAHRSCRHPMIHSAPIDYGNNGLEWRGRNLRIKMYDKLAQQKKRPGKAVRVEAQLRGRCLTTQLGKGQPVAKLRFATCYKAYRRIIKKFSPKLSPRVHNAIDLIAYVEEAHGIDLWPYWEQTYKNR